MNNSLSVARRLAKLSAPAQTLLSPRASITKLRALGPIPVRTLALGAYARPLRLAWEPLVPAPTPASRQWNHTDRFLFHRPIPPRSGNCCPIQSHYELGINATFWGKEDAEPKCEAVEVDPIEACARV